MYQLSFSKTLGEIAEIQSNIDEEARTVEELIAFAGDRQQGAAGSAIQDAETLQENL